MSADRPSTAVAKPPTEQSDVGLTHQWQIPLLTVAIALFVVALLQFRPSPQPLTFAERLEPLNRLLEARLYDLVVEDAAALLKQEGLQPLEAARLYRMTAEATYLAERSRRSHDRENAEWIIRNLNRAEASGFTLTGEDRRRLAAAWEWLGDPQRALDDYSLALRAGVKDQLKVERRVIGLQGKLGLLSNEELHRCLDGYMVRAREAPGEFIWALRERIDLFCEQGHFEAAGELLASARPRLRDMGEHQQADSLQALLLYRRGDYEGAERMLRAVRAKLEVRDEVYAQATCLLGRLNLRDDRPYEALAFYGDILDSYTSGPYLAASLLGAAEARATLQNYDQAAEHYGELIELLPFDFEVKLIDQEIIRTSLAVLHESLRRQGKLEQALRFIELANAPAITADPAVQAVFLEKLADAHVALAEHYGEQAEQAGPVKPVPTEGFSAEPAGDTEEARSQADPIESMGQHYKSAADTSALLAEKLAHNEEVATKALWRAAEYYDRAGETEETIKALQEFTSTRRTSSMLPNALLLLGRSYQAAEKYEQAVETYQANLTEFPHTPAALDSVAPLVRCYLAMGDEYFDRAEEALLALLDQTGDKEALITPSARQYHQALFLLGNIYVQAREYEKAITVLEETLARYPNDAGVSVTRFVLADSYRLSGMALRSDAERPGVGPARLGLLAEQKRRLRRARDLLAEAVEDFQQKRADLDPRTQGEYLRLSLSYQADCLFDLGLYQQALPLYEEVSWRYHDSPGALSAYVQIVSCYQRLGRRREAAAALKRARQLVGRIPQERFEPLAGGMTREQWEEFLTHVGDSPLFR